MKLQRLPAGLFWFPDSTPRGTVVAEALAGPYDTREAAYWWLIAKLEDGFTGAKRDLWAKAVDQMGTAPDAAHLMGLAMGIAAGRDAAWVALAAQPMRWGPRARTDQRAIASGEREAA